MWVRLSDDFADQPEIIQAGVPAAFLHVAALCWLSAHYLYDAVIPRGQVRRLADIDNPLDHAERLVDVGLWWRVGDDAGGDFMVANFERHLPPPGQRTDPEVQKQKQVLGRKQGYANTGRGSNGRFAPKTSDAPEMDESPLDTAYPPLEAVTSAPVEADELNRYPSPFPNYPRQNAPNTPPLRSSGASTRSVVAGGLCPPRDASQEATETRPKTKPLVDRYEQLFGEKTGTDLQDRPRVAGIIRDLAAAHGGEAVAFAVERFFNCPGYFGGRIRQAGWDAGYLTALFPDLIKGWHPPVAEDAPGEESFAEEPPASAPQSIVERLGIGQYLSLPSLQKIMPAVEFNGRRQAAIRFATEAENIQASDVLRTDERQFFALNRVGILLAAVLDIDVPTIAAPDNLWLPPCEVWEAAIAELPGYVSDITACDETEAVAESDAYERDYKDYRDYDEI